jgi:hypothetical protein
MVAMHFIACELYLCLCCISTICGLTRGLCKLWDDMQSWRTLNKPKRKSACMVEFLHSAPKTMVQLHIDWLLSTVVFPLLTEFTMI